MPNIAHHHVALRVADVERATRFYVEALGGTFAYEARLEGDFICRILSLPKGTSGRAAFLTFHGCALELFELAPTPPVPAADQSSDAIIHIGIQVDDVRAALERIEALGGRCHVPPRPFGSYHVAFCSDLDGHVLELLDATVEDCVALRGSELPDVADLPASAPTQITLGQPRQG